MIRELQSYLITPRRNIDNIKAEKSKDKEAEGSYLMNIRKILK